MAKATETFASHLENFALTIDIVDSRTADDVWRIAERYLKKYLSIDFVSLKVETLANNEAALTTVRGPYKGNQTYNLLIDGDPSGQTSYSALNNRRLWLVDSNKELLSSSSANHLDLWHGADDFPKSPAAKRETIRTSIFLPVEKNERVVAIVECESERYLEPTEGAKDELARLAEMIYRVHMLSQSYKTGSENTTEAVNRLDLSLQEGQWPEFARPQMFIATSGNADKKVTGQIKKVLDEFADRMDVVYWKKISRSGNVTKQIVEEISRSKFGLCYFSEPDTAPNDPKHKYRDNPNVVFEAGMLQALTNSPNAQPTGWIPVREKSSPDAPFDFAAERILTVDRSQDGELNEDAFQEKLKDRVANLLE
jgi:hypothetical protein